MDQILVRNYQGKGMREATKAYERDARDLAKRGYRPVGQTWAEGKRHGLSRLLTGGILLSPKGTLTVTYSLDASAPSAARR